MRRASGSFCPIVRLPCDQLILSVVQWHVMPVCRGAPVSSSGLRCERSALLHNVGSAGASLRDTVPAAFATYTLIFLLSGRLRRAHPLQEWLLRHARVDATFTCPLAFNQRRMRGVLCCGKYLAPIKRLAWLMPRQSL